MKDLGSPRRLTDYGRLDPVLRRMLERARSGGELSAGDAALLGRVAGKLPSVGAGVVSPTARGLLSARYALLLLAVGGTFGAIAAFPPPRQASDPAPEESYATIPAMAASQATTRGEAPGGPSDLPAIEAQALPDAPPPVNSATSPARSAARAASSDALASAPASEEVKLVAAAARALRGNPAEALSLAEQHARTYPEGVLRQEREALAIEALATTGGGEAARARLDAFEIRYPRSSHRARLERLFSP